jgi:hypothetical protein
MATQIEQFPTNVMRKSQYPIEQWVGDVPKGEPGTMGAVWQITEGTPPDGFESRNGLVSMLYNAAQVRDIKVRIRKQADGSLVFQFYKKA